MSNYMKKNHRPIHAKELLLSMAQVLQALEEMHALGFIHRDISPGNLFLTEDGDLYLIDFGSSISVDPESELHSMDYFEHRGFQAPEYNLVPEQGPWTDIYSLCATIFYLLTKEGVPSKEERKRYDLVPRILMQTKLTNQQQNAIIHGLNVDVSKRCSSIGSLKEKLLGKRFNRGCNRRGI